MKTIIKGAALMLAICVLAGCSLVEVNPDRQVVAKVKDQEITLAEFRTTADQLFAYYGVDPMNTAHDEYTQQIVQLTLESLVADKIQLLKVKELGLDYGQADIDQAQQTVDKILNEERASYKASLLESNEDMTEEEADALTQEYIDSSFTEDYTYDTFLQQTLNQIWLVRLQEESTKEIEVSEVELREAYDEVVAYEKETYATDIAAYLASLEEEDTPLFTPEGLYYIKHILLSIPEDKQYEIYQLRGEDKGTEADALLAEELEKIQAKADEALARVEAGEDFDALIAEYGEDPGMQSEPTMSQGYPMYKGSADYVGPFGEAAELLAADGQTSGLVATDYGYHILKRVSTVRGGTVAFDEVRQQMYDRLLASRKDTLYTELMTQWAQEYDVKYYYDRIFFE